MECEKKVGHVTDVEWWNIEITIESEKNENKEKKKGGRSSRWNANITWGSSFQNN
jgi:hypothetical protein